MENCLSLDILQIGLESYLVSNESDWSINYSYTNTKVCSLRYPVSRLENRVKYFSP